MTHVLSVLPAAVWCAAGMVKPLAPGFAPPPGFPEGPVSIGGRMAGAAGRAGCSVHMWRLMGQPHSAHVTWQIVLRSSMLRATCV